MAAAEKPETRVAIGITDSDRYIGVAPPLTRDEVRMMGWAGIIGARSVKQMDESDPACSLVRIESSSEPATDLALNIAQALRALRGGHIQHEFEPVWLNGQNSTPF